MAGGEIHFELGSAHLEEVGEAAELNGLALEAGQERTDYSCLHLTLEMEEACGVLGKQVRVPCPPAFPSLPHWRWTSCLPQLRGAGTLMVMMD